MNIQKLRQVQSWMREHPGNVDMGDWNKGRLVADKASGPTCGTMGCIAGWAIALDHGVFYRRMPLNLEPPEHYEDHIAGKPFMAGRQILELTYQQAKELFFIGSWDRGWAEKYLDSRPTRSQVVCDYIDHFIEKHQTDALEK